MVLGYVEGSSDDEGSFPGFGKLTDSLEFLNGGAEYLNLCFDKVNR